MRYSGREFTGEDLETIRAIIAENPKASRRRLSEIVCETLEWYMADGDLKDMSCRKAMLRMAEDGLITLPPRQREPTKRRPITKFSEATAPYACKAGSLDELGELEVAIITTASTSRLWNEYIARYHYLGHKTLTGAQLRYIVRAGGKAVALFGFSAAAWKIKPREEFIGWDDDQRSAGLPLIVNNSRFLVLPWLRIPNLASTLMAIMTKRLRADWLNRYEYAPVLLESFVERDRFDGGCYKAANWTCIGETQGRGKLDSTHQKSEPVKTIWVYPLIKSFRAALLTHQSENAYTLHPDI